MIMRVWEVTTGPTILGIHGKAGTGKDTICAMIAENYRKIYREAFADPLKACCAAAFGIPEDDFNDPDMKEEPNDVWGISPRKIAQFVGTEMFRDNIDRLLPETESDFWIRCLTNKLNSAYEAGETVIIPDVRFLNEAQWIKSNGGHVIHLLRSSNTSVGIPNHSSEDTIPFEADWIINNDFSRGALYDQVKNICEYLKLDSRSFYETI